MTSLQCPPKHHHQRSRKHKKLKHKVRVFFSLTSWWANQILTNCNGQYDSAFKSKLRLTQSLRRNRIMHFSKSSKIFSLVPDSIFTQCGLLRKVVEECEHNSSLTQQCSRRVAQEKRGFTSDWRSPSNGEKVGIYKAFGYKDVQQIYNCTHKWQWLILVSEPIFNQWKIWLTSICAEGRLQFHHHNTSIHCCQEMIISFDTVMTIVVRMHNVVKNKNIKEFMKFSINIRLVKQWHQNQPFVF